MCYIKYIIYCVFCIICDILCLIKYVMFLTDYKKKNILGKLGSFLKRQRAVEKCFFDNSINLIIILIFFLQIKGPLILSVFCIHKCKNYPVLQKNIFPLTEL